MLLDSLLQESQDEGGPHHDTHPGANDPGCALGPLHPPLLRVRPPAPAGEGGWRREAGQGGLQRRRLRDPGGRGDDGDDDDDDDDQVITTLLTLIAETIVISSRGDDGDDDDDDDDQVITTLL